MEVEVREGRCTQVFSLFSVRFHSGGDCALSSDDILLLVLFINMKLRILFWLLCLLLCLHCLAHHSVYFCK